MGNFASSSCSASSRPTTTPSPPSTSHSTTLTSTLTTHATRIAHRCSSGRIRLDDIEEGTADADDTVLNGRHRALLIGIAYNGELINSHTDVDRYRDLLLDTYGYQAQDIVMLKDDPSMAAHVQPTRENILRELRHLVADAAPGDCFTFLYSGHSNQQRSKRLNGEDFKDEYLITIDDEIIVDTELNDILVNPLPAGCSFFALLDTCHSGTTLLDLPHHHCNSAYVSRRSKCKRRTQSWQNVTVRRNAASIQDPISTEAPLLQTATATAIANIIPAWRKPSSSAPPKLRCSVLPLSIDRPRVTPGPIEVCTRERDLPSPSHAESKTPPTVVPLAKWEAYDNNSSLTTQIGVVVASEQKGGLQELMISMLHQCQWTRSEEKVRPLVQASASAVTARAEKPVVGGC